MRSLLAAIEREGVTPAWGTEEVGYRECACVSMIFACAVCDFVCVFVICVRTFSWMCARVCPLFGRMCPGVRSRCVLCVSVVLLFVSCFVLFCVRRICLRLSRVLAYVFVRPCCVCPCAGPCLCPGGVSLCACCVLSASSSSMQIQIRVETRRMTELRLERERLLVTRVAGSLTGDASRVLKLSLIHI